MTKWKKRRVYSLLKKLLKTEIKCVLLFCILLQRMQLSNSETSHLSPLCVLFTVQLILAAVDLSEFRFKTNAFKQQKKESVMSFLNELKAKKQSLKSTITNIKYLDGSQEQILLSTGDQTFNSERKIQPNVYGFVVDTKPDSIPACILDNLLYLGSQDAVCQENLDKYGLTDILSVGIQTPSSAINRETLAGKCYYIECLDLPETKIDSVIERTNKIIENIRDRNGRILVHCNAGVSRSASVCIAYLMCILNMSFDSAYNLVKSKRECIQPNTGFKKQLKELQPISKIVNVNKTIH